jgi:hypothetical protein
MISFLFVLGVIAALFVALIQGGWSPFVNVGSDVQRGGSAIYNMIKGGKRNKSNKGKSNK